MCKHRRAALAAAVCGLIMVLASGIPAMAQEDMIRLFNPVVGRMRLSVELEGLAANKQQVEDRDASLSYTRQSLSLITPVWQNSGNEAGLNFKFEQQANDTNAVLPDSGDPFPETLANLSLGGFYRHKTDGGVIWGGSFNLASPSDKPFGGESRSTLSLAGFARLPRSPRQSWLLFMGYTVDGQAGTNYPFPGFGWMYTPSPGLQLILGLPALYLRYQPCVDWTFSALYFMPRTYKLRAGYRLTDRTELFASLGSEHRSWYRSDRVHEEDTLQWYENMGLLGLEIRPFPSVTLELSGGYVFDRMIFEGENYDDRHQNRIDLENGGIVQCRLSIAF